MIPFYQRISGTNFEICFSRSCSPNLVTKQTYFGNFTRLQTHFGCQNREASTEETWWHCFCIFHSSFFTDFCHSTNRNQICSVSEHVLSHRRNVASLTLFYRYYFGRCSSELTQLVPLHFSRERSTRYSDRLHDFSVTIPKCYKHVYVDSFVPHTARLWNSLPIECFPFTYDLSGFKSRINIYLLSVGSF